MAEETIAQPLSGEEIVNRVMHAVKQKLHGDCNLNPVFAYDWFMAKVKVELWASDSGREVEVKVETTDKAGEVIEQDQWLKQAEAQIGKAPPNQVRQESGQGIPTKVTDNEGRERLERVKYAGGKEAGKAQ